jgi:hypothetical protein
MMSTPNSPFARTVVVICMAQLMLVLDELIANTALPHIQQDLPDSALVM